MKKCRKCLLPAAVPGSQIGPDGICGFCRAPKSEPSSVRPNPTHREDLEHTLSACRNEDRRYHCLVPLSGWRVDPVHSLGRSGLLAAACSTHLASYEKRPSYATGS